MFRIFMVLMFVFSVPALSWAQSYDRSSSASAAAAEIRFQQLEKEIRRLTGMVEEQGYEIRRLRGELFKVTSDLELRVRGLEGGSVLASSPNKVKPLPLKNPEPAKTMHTLGTINKSQEAGGGSSSDDALKAYNHAYSFIKMRDFDNAEKAFATFMDKFPKHKLVSNAKYWYGETFYVRGSYEKSARIFAEGYQRYPRGPKAASNLLKLGMALTGMGKKEDACIAYKQLKKDYSKSSVPVLKRAETEMKRINCR